MKSKSLILVYLLIFITIFSGCTYGSHSIRSGSIDMSSSEISGSYSKFNGFKQKKFDFIKGDKVNFNTEIKTESGNLSITVLDENDSIIHEIDESGQTTVNIEKNGNYYVRVDGQKHKGNFSIKLDYWIRKPKKSTAA